MTVQTPLCSAHSETRNFQISPNFVKNASRHTITHPDVRKRVRASCTGGTDLHFVPAVRHPAHPLSAIQRLNVLHRSVRQCSFISLADALEAELHCVGRGAAVKRVVAFYSGPECTRLLTTTVSSKRFKRGNSALLPEFKDFALSPVTHILEREIDTLACSKNSQCEMKSFTPEHIQKFTPKLLDVAHR